MSDNSDIDNQANIAIKFCATIVEEWVRHYSTQAFIAPGSRSTPLALALEFNPAITTHMFIDERACAFAALGSALSTRTPAIVLCSSGTAGTHFYAAVVEANLSDIPLIVCTADRPFELQNVSAPQAIDQTNLYGKHVRYETSPGVPDLEQSGIWRSIGSRLALEAIGTDRAGPVHANLSFREPLVSNQLIDIEDLPKGRDNNQPWHNHKKTEQNVSKTALAELIHSISSKKGIIAVGNDGAHFEGVRQLATKLGWPLFAGPRSNCKDSSAIKNFDQLLRVASFTESFLPDVVIQFGENLSSKYFNNYVKNSGCTRILVSNGRWNDPHHQTSQFINDTTIAKQLLAEDIIPADKTWLKEWQKTDQNAQAAIEKIISDFDSLLSGPEIAQSVTTELAAGESLVVSSSMPIREVEWFGAARTDLYVYSNRGANGIDGVVSTAIGVATSGTLTTVLIGDIAFLHDSTALVGLSERNINLTIVIVDNGGGQIFSHLTQAEVLDNKIFNKLFITPQSTNLLGLCEAHNLPTEIWEQPDTFSEVLQKLPDSGARVVIAKSGQDKDLYLALEKAVAEALDASLNL